MSPRVAVVVGNPKPESRTLAAALQVAVRLGEPTLTIDLATLGTALLDPDDAHVAGLVAEFAGADLLVVASPTYQGTYTGLLKVFLDRLPYRGLTGRIGVPVMVGAGPGHQLAPDLYLRQVLNELGADVPVRPLYVLEKAYDDPAGYDDWAALNRPLIDAVLAARAAA